MAEKNKTAFRKALTDAALARYEKTLREDTAPVVFSDAYREEIARLEEKLQEAVCDSARLIARLPNEEMARILEMRYLDGWIWEDIIDEMDMGSTRVYELHRKALDILTPAPEAGE